MNSPLLSYFYESWYGNEEAGSFDQALSAYKAIKKRLQ